MGLRGRFPHPCTYFCGHTFLVLLGFADVSCHNNTICSVGFWWLLPLRLLAQKQEKKEVENGFWCQALLRYRMKNRELGYVLFFAFMYFYHLPVAIKPGQL